MIVEEAKLPGSDTRWPGTADLVGASQDRTRTADIPTEQEIGDERLIRFVSPPPLIPRIYPGL